MTTMLISGCSHTAGAEILGKGMDAKPELAYGASIADHFGFDWFNISKSGASNEHIVNATINWILSQSIEIKSDMCVLVGWTTTPRLSFYHENYLVHTTPGLIGNKDAINNMVKHMNDGENLHKLIEYYFGMIDHKSYMNQWFNDIIYLDSFMKNNNIPYIMVNTGMHYYESHYKKNINGRMLKLIDNAFYPNQDICYDPCLTPDTEVIVSNITNYYKPTDSKSTFFGICDEFPKTEWQHFGKEAHDYYGKYIIPYIEDILNGS